MGDRNSLVGRCDGGLGRRGALAETVSGDGVVAGSNLHCEKFKNFRSDNSEMKKNPLNFWGNGEIYSLNYKKQKAKKAEPKNSNQICAAFTLLTKY